MDDNNEKSTENQSHSTPIFESVPVDSLPEVEEVPPELPSNPNPPVYQESSRQYVFIFVGVIVFFIIVFFLLRGIFSGKTVAKKVTLNYWGLWEEKSIIDPIISQYQQKNPNVKINYQEMSPTNYREKLVARSKNGQGPDIFRFHNTWLPEISEVVSPLPSSVMTPAEFDKTFYPIAKKDLNIGSYYYGLPLEIDSLVLIYNNSLFKKAAVTTVPSTWDDITNIVPRLTVKDQTGELITSGLAVGTAENVEHFSDIFGLLLVQNGGSIAKLDQQEAAGALEIYRKFAENPQNYWSGTMPNSLTAFIQEKVAMIIAPSWEAMVIKAANPEIDMKVVPVPSVPGAASVSLATYWVEGVSRYSQNQLEAWKFLKYLTEKDTMTKLYELQSRIRLFGEPYSRVDLAPLLATNQYLGAVIKSANNLVSLPLISRTYDNGLNDGINQYLRNAINSTIQGVSYNEALKNAKLGIDQIFTRYNISK